MQWSFWKCEFYIIECFFKKFTYRFLLQKEWRNYYNKTLFNQYKMKISDQIMVFWDSLWIGYVPLKIDKIYIDQSL